MESPPKKIWFPAKKYGWGWGPPCAWQGWVVLAAYVAIVSVLSFMLMPAHLLWWYLSIAGASIVLTAIGWLKGEKPRWRWGGD